MACYLFKNTRQTANYMVWIMLAMPDKPTPY